MAEINTVIAEASQDLQTIEDFVNLPAGSDVRPRLLPSVNVGTLASTRQAIFEAGGLPATPFATKALMTASALVDGKYAQVTDDTINNGLYVKNEGAWVKSAYDPLTQAKDYVDDIAYGDGVIDAKLNVIAGAAINSTGSLPVIAVGSDRKYIKIDVSKSKQLEVQNSTVSEPWKWVFVDELMSNPTYPNKWGNTVITVPETAYYALRTFKSGAIEDSSSLSIKLTARVSSLEYVSNKIPLLDKLVDDNNLIVNGGSEHIAYQPVEGAAVKTEAVNPILATGSDRSYIKIDVRRFKSVTISGARTDIPEWMWKTAGYDDLGIAITGKKGNVTIEIPDNVAYLYRTYHVGGVRENVGMSISGVRKIKSLKELMADIDTLKQNVTPSYTPSRMAEKMQEDFDAGRMISINDFPAASQHEQIEQAINFIKMRGHGILDMESGVWLRNSAVLLPSNCWVYLNNAEIKLADGVFDNIIRNDGIVVNPDPFGYALELKENINIRVFGASKTTAFVSGANVPYAAPHPINGGASIPWTGDFFGWRTLGILLANVKDYKLHSFGMRKTTCWAISQEHGNDNFDVYDIAFDTTVKNGDGVDVRQGCSNGRIYNITGKTSDDMVALSALNRFIGQHPSGNYIYPMQVGGYENRGFGVDITGINISNIKGSGEHHGVRLLASGGSKLKNIAIDGVSDTTAPFLGAVVLVSSGYGIPSVMGDMKNITVNGVTSNLSETPLRISGSIQDSAFNDIQQKSDSATIVDDTSTKDNVSITNFRKT